MIRGTTPTFLYNLPFSASIIKSAEITIEHVDNFKKVLMTKTLEDCELGEKSISTTLTQEETLQLPASATILVQLRVLTKDNKALATEPEAVKVTKLLAEGVIK